MLVDILDSHTNGVWRDNGGNETSDVQTMFGESLPPLGLDRPPSLGPREGRPIRFEVPFNAEVPTTLYIFVDQFAQGIISLGAVESLPLHPVEQRQFKFVHRLTIKPSACFEDAFPKPIPGEIIPARASLPPLFAPVLALILALILKSRWSRFS